jgi:hypothetical protein
MYTGQCLCGDVTFLRDTSRALLSLQHVSASHWWAFRGAGMVARAINLME